MNNLYRLVKSIKKDGVKFFKKGEILFHENEECNSLGIINSGSVIISSYTSDGKEIVFNYLKIGEMFGSNLIFSKNPFYKGDVIAKEDCSLYIINKKELLILLQGNADFLSSYLEYQSEMGMKLNMKIKMLSYDKAQERLFYLLFLNSGKLPYKSISELAKNMNVSRECCSRLLSELVKKSAIEIKNKCIYKK